MAIDTRSDFAVATQLLKDGWVHSFVPYGVDLTERLSWLVDIYGEPRGTELFFNPYNIPDTGDWLLIRLDAKFKEGMGMTEEYLLLFCSEQMRLAYALRFPR
jgi:hypothetical protein